MVLNRTLKLLVPLTLLIFLIACAAKKELDSTEDPDLVEERMPGNSYLWAFKPSTNIRESNSARSSKFAVLTDGDSIMVMSNDNGWYKVKTESGKTGWIRMDLLGPKNLSAFRYAVAFVDSLKENRDIELYFDKKLHHKRIYLSFPADYYSSKTSVEKSSREIVEKYQNQVYQGEVTARVLKPGSEEEYLTVVIDGQKNADPILPVIPFGQIISVRNTNPGRIELFYSVSEKISDENLLFVARDISAAFPLSYQRVEVTFFNSSSGKNIECRLWFMEDKNGEDFKYNQCE